MHLNLIVGKINAAILNKVLYRESLSMFEKTPLTEQKMVCFDHSNAYVRESISIKKLMENV